MNNELQKELSCLIEDVKKNGVLVGFDNWVSTFEDDVEYDEFGTGEVSGVLSMIGTLNAETDEEGFYVKRSFVVTTGEDVYWFIQRKDEIKVLYKETRDGGEYVEI